MFSPCLDGILWEGFLKKQQLTTRKHHYKPLKATVAGKSFSVGGPTWTRADPAVSGQASTTAQPVLTVCEVVFSPVGTL